ncbi:MAG: hypothetical protein Q4Q25_00835 [Methanocorpusculum sp.]|nr:hypothetical protein [Methanocorpusculum sp.]
MVIIEAVYFIFIGMNSIPAKQLLMSGTKSELALNLLDREIGWSTDDNAPYIKLDGELVKFGGGDAMVVTYDGTAGDKTYEEILAAHSAGKVVVLTDSQNFFIATLSQVIPGTDTIYFANTHHGAEAPATTQWSVTSEDVWSTSTESSIGEAPVDNKAYGRWNGTWSEVALKTYVDDLVGDVESLLAAL